MTWVFLFLWLVMGPGVWAEPVELQVWPPDAEVWVALPSQDPERVGSAGQLLDLPAGPGRLILRREGWLERDFPLTDKPKSIELAPDPARSGARVQFYLLRYGWLALPLPVALIAWWLRKNNSSGEPARMVGAYELLSPLAEGGMAELYRARAPNRKWVALKLLKPEDREDEEIVKRFRREIEVGRQLQHPNLVRMLDSGEADGLPYLAMELLDGETLRDLMAREGKVEPGQAVDWIAQAMEGVAAAHKLGLAHRDLKPENLYLTREGVIKVIDFGVARGESFTIATATGMIMGTPAYIAPEQLEGSVDVSIDQYALGIVLYELLTGRPPFSDPDPVALAYKHANDPLPPLPQELPAGLCRVVHRMLLKNPLLRYEDLGEARRELIASL